MDFEDFLDFLFPNNCFGCGKILSRGRVLCKTCQERLPVQHTLRCGLCRKPLAYAEQICHAKARYCLGTAGDYQHPLLQELIHALKFQGIRQAALPLARLLIRYCSEVRLANLGNPLVLPIPLHRKREQTRGFNQTALIGNIVSDYFGFECSSNILIRTRATLPQSGLSHDARGGNLRGCFGIANPTPICDRTIILLDDVTTSGATFNEAAATVLRYGARSVFALAVAKA